MLSDGVTECSFMVGSKDCLAVRGKISDTNYGLGSWGSSHGQGTTILKEWLGSTLKNAFPSSLISIFKLWKVPVAYHITPANLVYYDDYISIAAATEICETASYTAENGKMTHFEYYKDDSHRIKHLGTTGGAVRYWTRTMDGSEGSQSCYITISTKGEPFYSTDGSGVENVATDKLGIAPILCI